MQTWGNSGGCEARRLLCGRGSGETCAHVRERGMTDVDMLKRGNSKRKRELRVGTMRACKRGQRVHKLAEQVIILEQ